MFTITKNLNYFNKNDFLTSQTIEKIKFTTEEDALKYLKRIKPNKIINKKYISIFESYKLKIKLSSTDYKIYFKEATFKGIFKNV